MNSKNFKKDKKDKTIKNLHINPRTYTDVSSLTHFMTNYFLRFFEHFNKNNIKKVKLGEDYFYINEDDDNN